MNMRSRHQPPPPELLPADTTWENLSALGEGLWRDIKLGGTDCVMAVMFITLIGALLAVALMTLAVGVHVLRTLGA